VSQATVKEGSSLLSVSDLTVKYFSDGVGKTAINKAALSIPSTGYTVGIVGESGSGKTTLGMSILNAIDPPGKITQGTILYQGKNVLRMSERQLRRYRGKEVSVIYQSALNSLNPVKRIADHVIEVLRAHNTPKDTARLKAAQMLSEVGIKIERANDYPHELSGGMRQRVVIAMALALSPKILIADEPSSALDVVVQRQILQLLKREIEQRGLSLVFITHEIALLNGLVDNVIVMYSGEIIEQGPIGKVLYHPKHPYTEMLLGSLLTLEPKLTNESSAAEQPNNPPAAITNGDSPTKDSTRRMTTDDNYCKYAGRCKYVFDRCWNEKPILKNSGEQDRSVACHKYN
jgi:ABC-type dipeptide/oligopeptide/nickel transport system ATPase component